MARRKYNPTRTGHEELQIAAPNVSRFLVFVSCLSALGAMVYGLWWPVSPAVSTADVSPVPPTAILDSTLSTDQATAAPSGSSDASAAAFAPTTETTPGPPLIGIVVGHWGSDQGAVCPDGLTEVEVNLDVAQRVVKTLKDLGYQAELLEEYDPRLETTRPMPSSPSMPILANPTPMRPRPPADSRSPASRTASCQRPKSA